MNHEKTFEAINKLKDIELELHRLKNALEMTNKAVDAKRTWVGLTDEEIKAVRHSFPSGSIDDLHSFARAILDKSKEKNNA